MQKKHLKIIAEIGCSHIGSVERAKNLIYLAKESGADYVKLQKRNPKESVPKKMWDKPHPNPKFSYGKTYLEHRCNLELDIDQHIEILDYCNSIGIKYSSSVWDLTSSQEIVSLNPDFIKVPSSCNENVKMLDYLFNNYEGQVHISTGMLSKKGKSKLLNYVTNKNVMDRTVIYHCTSEYPCPSEHLYLLEIEKLCRRYKHVGFSNHGCGIYNDIIAYVLGARWIERHFIDDKAFRHTDASSSLDPKELSNLTSTLKEIKQSLNYKSIDMTEEEEKQKNKLKIVIV